MRVFALLLAHAACICGFKYDLTEDFVGDNRFSFSERYSFATNEGPALARTGESYISTDLAFTVSNGLKADAYNISVLFYRTGMLEMGPAMVDLCHGTGLLTPHYEAPQLHSFALKSETRTTTGAGGTFSGRVTDYYNVTESGLIYALFQLCPTVPQPEIKVQGFLTFRNPYGYLPGMYYGYLPFQAARTAAFMAVVALFLVACFRHRGMLLRLHYAMLAVLILAMIEAFTWFLAYKDMNNSGHPYCCPFPESVVVATSMEVLRKTSSRLLLLLVCLGYGITRMTLDKLEKLAVAGLTAAYLASTIMDNISFIVTASHIGAAAGVERSAAFAVPAMLCDMLYLFWIYMALMNMLQALQDANETYKLQMYTRLSWTISISVMLFALLAVALTAGQAGSSTWEWQWQWVQDVSWQILNFGVLCAVCTLWRPSDRSAQLAYSKQVPTGEEDADARDAGVELGGGHSFTIGGDDQSDDENDEMDEENGPGPDGLGSNGDFVGGGSATGDDKRKGKGLNSPARPASSANRSQAAAVQELGVRPGTAVV